MRRQLERRVAFKRVARLAKKLSALEYEMRVAQQFVDSLSRSDLATIRQASDICARQNRELEPTESTLDADCCPWLSAGLLHAPLLTTGSEKQGANAELFKIICPLLEFYDYNNKGPEVPKSVQFLGFKHITNVTFTLSRR